jgi:hypothetical protein
MKIEILRTFEQGGKQTLGELSVIDNNGKVVYKCATLELPWRENQRRISCIPTGTFKARLRRAADSPSRNYDHIHIHPVPNRTWILIHRGNYHFHIEGCVLVGKNHVDINRDGLLDVTNSTIAMNELMAEVQKHVKWGQDFDVVVRYRD